LLVKGGRQSTGLEIARALSYAVKTNVNVLFIGRFNCKAIDEIETGNEISKQHGEPYDRVY